MKTMKDPARVKLQTPITTPMCDVARACDELGTRLRHYRDCTDPRCAARKDKFVSIVKMVKEGK